MMEAAGDVKLLRSWYASYCTRVELALKLKGIAYECMDEDSANKSESLVKYNPVYKKVPVLLHDGKPIMESLIILDYIDDCWNNEPKLLPDDPYERAKVRFWSNYYDHKFMPGVMKILMSSKTEREKAIEEFSGMLKVLEEGIARDFPQGTPFCCNQTLGFLDIVVGSSGCNYRAFFEALGMEFPVEKNRKFFSWVDGMNEVSLMKDTLPPHDEMVKKIRTMFGLGQKI